VVTPWQVTTTLRLNMVRQGIFWYLTLTPLSKLPLSIGYGGSWRNTLKLAHVHQNSSIPMARYSNHAEDSLRRLPFCSAEHLSASCFIHTKGPNGIS
jgi:hypothetical protein